MLPKINRLRLRTELKQIKLTGSMVSGDYFSLLIRQRTDNRPSRFAFIVSRKVHTQSVRRNQVRRLLSEAVYGLLPENKVNSDIVFLVRPSIVGKNLSQIKNAVKKIMPPAN